ncbi:uncharacterized protein LOC143901618 [Temnothorax americanus]|uniref:uncharacterized protein LOC143901618 n=1 Tax=Temnothorax americanus TaxID=1964332 RepID=UPI00406808A1
MIEQNAALPDVQKMQYLMSSLKGEAHDVVSSLEASAENYRERLWKIKIDWNETLPRQISTEWSNYIQELQDLEKINIPRKIVRSGQEIRNEIHGFCDASEHAYGACIYMRSIRADGVTEVHLICAKSRVAPLKILSTPRLELQGAQLLSELTEKASNKKLPVFVAQRVGSIQETTAVDNWRHVGSGRLRHANLRSDVKHPWLLPQRSKLTELIIEHEHRKLMHAGPEATLAAMQLRYWSLKARGTIRKVLRRCIRCFKAKPKFSEQLMGDLPTHRVVPSKPFSHTGVDFCGPIYVREGSRRNAKSAKAYVAVFVCMATKAVHLEVVSSMTTDAFLSAFKRFIGKEANRQMYFLITAPISLEQTANWKNLETYSPKKSTSIRSQKSLLQTKLSGTSTSGPSFRRTVEGHCKGIQETFLQTGHFLIGDTITSYPEPDVTQVKANRLSHWQHLEQMRQHFWRRWSNEYLLQLQNRTKWCSNRCSVLKVGQLVICREDGLPPLKWVLGRVQETCPGADGVVRTAVIKTSTGSFKRPAAKLAILPLEEDLDNTKD